MNVAFLPVYPNPYQTLLRDALAAEGVGVTFLEKLPPDEWLRANRASVDILHYHWLDGLYMSRFRTPLQVARFVAHFRLVRELGYRTVWTAHNILPHRTAFRPLHTSIRRLFMANADAVIVHCDFGRHELLARFPRSGPVRVIPIGSYGGLYPLTMSRGEARASLDIPPSAFVTLSLGNIAAYKGLDRLVEAFSRVARPDDVIVIAGRNRDPGGVRRLQRAAARDPRIRVHPGFIPDDEMQRYLLAADVMALPFERVLTSSSVIVGLAYGLPIVVPDLGCLPELVTSDAGEVYRTDEAGALERALQRIRQRDLAAMGAAARRIADGLAWDDIGRRTAAVYRECLAS